MNKALIINFSCFEMPYNAEFCVGLSAFSGHRIFLVNDYTFSAKHFKIVQLVAVCSSQIIVS